MKKSYCVLILLFISTGYLFSQSAKNEMLEENTITLTNTAVVTEVDAVVIEESVSEPEEKTDLSNYDFYNDYLDYVKQTNSTGDVPLANECKNNAIISCQIGGGIFAFAYSIELDIPINCNDNITSKYVNGIKGIDGADRFSFLGIGLGQVAKKNKYFIIKLNVCLGLATADEKRRPGMNVGADILFKVFEHCYVSISPDFITVPRGLLGIISLGLNLVY
jgi:hypothetical protein